VRLTNRVRKLLARSGSTTEEILRRHWDRVFAERRARLDQFLADVPAHLRARVRAALGDPDWLLDRGPGFPGYAAGAIAAFAHMRSCLDIAYGYRHTFATDGLASGLPETHVAELLGHGSTAMLHKHYAHLTAKAGVLRNAAALVRPAATPATDGTASPIPA
jgi:integrase